jgi:hypothetical protein
MTVSVPFELEPTTVILGMKVQTLKSGGEKMILTIPQTQCEPCFAPESALIH